MKTIYAGLSIVIIIGLSVCSPVNMPEDNTPLNTPEQMLLKNWQPKSVYKAPATEIKKAKFPVIDMHAHAYTKTPQDVAERVRIMDGVGVEKSVLLTYATGAKFDSIYALYAKYPDRFEVYCGLDFSDFPKENWIEKTISELKRCVKAGAKGIGEVHDKGKGIIEGVHADDVRLDPIFNACVEMNIPINFHTAEPIWMYEPMDSTNDGLMRSWTWRVKDKEGMVDHQGLMEILSNMLKRHPDNTFVIAHLANCSFDFSILARMFDQYPNFYADISARFAEFSAIPRATAKFFTKYQDRIVYGTDYGWEVWDKHSDYGNNTSLDAMFKMTFRVLETEDEHFYLTDLVGYKWPLYGLGLNDEVLRKIYRDNALKLVKKE